MVNPAAGTFHPKLIVGGTSFGDDDLLASPRLLIVGSANLTRGGLDSNVECSLVRTSERDLDVAARAFRRLWQQGTELDQQVLAEYETYFAEQNRGRAAQETWRYWVSLMDQRRNSRASASFEVDEKPWPEREEYADLSCNGRLGRAAIFHGGI